MTAIEINTLLLHTIVAAVVLCTCLGWFLYLREIAKPYSLGHHNTPILVGFAGFCAGTGVAVPTRDGGRVKRTPVAFIVSCADGTEATRLRTELHTAMEEKEGITIDTGGGKFSVDVEVIVR
jgi:short subunit fatty acids transporter